MRLSSWHYFPDGAYFPMGVSDLLPFLETYVAIEVLVTVRRTGER
jgi:hypothetical protein